MLSSLLNIGGKLVGEVVDRILPEKMSEGEKAQLKLKALEISNRLMMERYEQEIKDTISARDFAAVESQQAPAFIRILRGLVRPVIGLFCATLWGWGTILAPYFGYQRIELSQFDYTILLSVFAFFFGLRTFEKARGVQNRG